MRSSILLILGLGGIVAWADGREPAPPVARTAAEPRPLRAPRDSGAVAIRGDTGTVALLST